MVPSKLPKMHTRSRLLLQLAIFLLVGSILLNVKLWHSITEQGKQIYERVSEIVPGFAHPVPLAQWKTSVVVNKKDLTCLARNLYHESRSESDLGKLAVAMVVLNRVDSPLFPNTICDVIYQPSRNPARPKGCQFSWTCDGKSDDIKDMKQYEAILTLSSDILRSRDSIVNVIDGALYYHAVYVNPNWAKYFDKVARIDTHIFYKDKQ
jgi:spore germination cell wall hydrolase CwlJ-like protein